jgi:hypothetical protein
VPGVIYRYEIPVDDQWHDLELSGAVLHVAARKSHAVELWALDTGGPAITRTFRVFGTGQPLPDGRPRHIGTALAAGGQLVWHLMERH